jgi:hypothetical protein
MLKFVLPILQNTKTTFRDFFLPQNSVELHGCIFKHPRRVQRLSYTQSTCFSHFKIPHGDLVFLQ